MNQDLDLDLDLPYICCGICFKDCNELKGHTVIKLLLTSCAHITCDNHIQSQTSELYIGNKPITYSCPVCGTSDISTVPINNNLPEELKNFFIPTPQQIDLLNSSGKFQYCALVDRINHYKASINKLNEKVKKQKEFLYAAKEEITHLSKYKSKVEELNQEIETLKAQLSEIKRPDTFDLSNEDLVEDMNLQRHNIQPRRSPLTTTTVNGTTTTPSASTALHTFIQKVHKQSSQKIIPSSKSNSNLQNPHGRRYSEVLTKPSFFAESTKIGELTSNSHTSSASSNASSSNSLNKFSYNKPTRVRPSTSQLASRITANMKVGTPLGSSNTVAGSYGTKSTSRISKGPTLTRTLRRASEASPYFGGSSKFNR